MHGIQKIFAGVLMLVWCLTATSSRELLKLPMLAIHYYDHVSEGQKKDILSFLVQHYWVENGSDEDAGEDSTLPFIMSDDILSFSFLSIAPLLPGINDQMIILPLAASFPFCNDDDISTRSPEAVWQPPRNC